MQLNLFGSNEPGNALKEIIDIEDIILKLQDNIDALKYEKKCDNFDIDTKIKASNTQLKHYINKLQIRKLDFRKIVEPVFKIERERKMVDDFLKEGDKVRVLKNEEYIKSLGENEWMKWLYLR